MWLCKWQSINLEVMMGKAKKSPRVNCSIVEASSFVWVVLQIPWRSGVFRVLFVVAETVFHAA
jgi:hypothetical protein